MSRRPPPYQNKQRHFNNNNNQQNQLQNQQQNQYAAYGYGYGYPPTIQQQQPQSQPQLATMGNSVGGMAANLGFMAAQAAQNSYAAYYGMQTPYGGSSAYPPQMNYNYYQQQQQQQQQLQQQRFTPEGYSISSTAPQNYNTQSSNSNSNSQPVKCTFCNIRFRHESHYLHHKRDHVKCDYPGCSFEATRNHLEIHQEDRHLIFKRPKKVEKTREEAMYANKQPYIEGTNIKVDTPEAIAKWIEDRKKRYPKGDNKKQSKAAEPEPPKKKQKLTKQQDNNEINDNNKSALESLVGYTSQAENSDNDNNDNDDDDHDEPPESTGVREEHVKQKELEQEPLHEPLMKRIPIKQNKNQQKGKRKYIQQQQQSQKQDKKDLLSQLLVNDVAKQVSDIMQVFNFLVDNDFLENVELKPGDADENFIHELDQANK